MKPCKGDTTMAAFMCYILGGGDEVGNTSQEDYTTGGQGPHALKSPRSVSMNYDPKKS